ncbi:MAG: hypothetical protein AB8H79_18380 [Myxococcota bacterium]
MLRRARLVGVFLGGLFGAALWGTTPAMAEPAPSVAGVRARLRLEVGRSDGMWVAPLHDEGVALIHHDTQGQRDLWRVVLFDRSFKERGRHILDVPLGLTRLAYAVEGRSLHLALSSPSRTPRPQLVMLPLDGAPPTVLSMDARGKTGAVVDLVVVGGDAYARAMRKGRGRLLHTRLDSGETRVVPPPAIVGQKPKVMGLVRSQAGDQVDATSRSRGGPSVVAVAGYRGGLETSLRIVDPHPWGNWVGDVRRSTLDDGLEVLVGTYSAAGGSGAQGLFLARYNGAVPVGTDTHAFADFDGFFDHMREAKRERVQRRARRKRAKGKELGLGLGVLLHPIVEQDGRFLVTGEAFYPEFKTRTQRTTVWIDGVAQTQSVVVQEFVGFRRTHAFTAAFDRTGERLWESSLPMGDVLTMDLRRRVRVQAEGDDVRLRYVYGNRVVSRGVGASGENTRVVETLSDGDGWRPGNSDSAWWYGNTFLAWGFNKVRDGSKPGKQRVFFMAALDGSTAD